MFMVQNICEKSTCNDGDLDDENKNTKKHLQSEVPGNCDEDGAGEGVYGMQTVLTLRMEDAFPDV